MNYLELLSQLHQGLRPAVYLEIGIAEGATLALSSTRTIGVDPAPGIRGDVLAGKPWLKLFRSTSDDFFRSHSAEASLEGFPLDLAFIDGLHEFAQVVRDMQNVERWAQPGTVIVIHDVLPKNVFQASRAYHEGRWTGDVWRIVPFLREHRPDLRCRLVDVRDSGALIVTRLDPGFPDMGQRAQDLDQRFPGDGAAYDRLVASWIETARPEAAEDALRSLLQGRSLGGAVSTAFQTRNARPSSGSAPASVAPAVGVLESSVHRGMRILPESSWRPVLQRSIDAFYEGKLDEGIAACLTLLNEPALPAHIRDLTFRNQTFYARSLADLCPGVRWQALPPRLGDGAALSAPSPVVMGDRLVVLARSEAGQAGSARVSLTLEDAELPEVEVLTLPARAGSGATLSDVSPFAWQDMLYVAAMIREGDDERTARAGVMQFCDGEFVEVAWLGPRAGHFRQGWSPVTTPEGPRFVAWWEPTEVFQFDEAMSGFERVTLRLAPHLAERFRGGPQGVAVPGGYLFLVNETATFDDGHDVSQSRFVLIDERFQITAVSPQVFLAERGTEVATGLALQEDLLHAGFVSATAGALLATLDLEPVLASLVPVAAPGDRRPASAP